MLPLAYINIYVSNENEYKTKKTWNNRQTYDYIKMFSDLEIENYVNANELIAEIDWSTEIDEAAEIFDETTININSNKDTNKTE